MVYRKRVQSEGDVYHVFSRGTGKRVIFEDDEDCHEFLRRAGIALDAVPGELYAWCLMGNHFHLVAHMEIAVLASFMKRLCGGYAIYFNARHGREGHLLEGRYGSEPVRSDEQLLAAVRYVHRNPVAAGISVTCDYPWSSYREYLGCGGLADTRIVLEMLGDTRAFVEFHSKEGDGAFLDVREADVVGRRRFTHGEALALSKSVLGEERFERLPGMPKVERDEALRKLSQAGISIRQIALVTGVGRSIVQRAVLERHL